MWVYYKMDDEDDDFDGDEGLEECMEKLMDWMRGVGLESLSEEESDESEDEEGVDEEDEGVLLMMFVGEVDKDIFIIDVMCWLVIVNCEW